MEFYSGAPGQPGRFRKGFCLRRVQQVLSALAEMRMALRPRFVASPLHDAAGLARAVEAACRTLWDE
jgi:hypothetical protein